MVMTPQLRQAIALLQMSALELNSFVSNEMLENPYLTDDDDRYDSPTDDYNDDREPQDTVDSLEAGDYGSTEESQDFNWDNVYDGDAAPSNNSSSTSLGELTDSDWATTNSSETETLQSMLVGQWNTLMTDSVLRFIGLYLIDMIDEAGYMRTPLAEISKKLNVDVDKVDDALAILQTLEPAGVAAQNLAECLLLQLHAQDNLTDTARVVLENLDLLAKQDLTKLAKLSGATPQHVLEAIEDISTCNPKPGLAYGYGSTDAVIPDIMVLEDGDKFKVELNSAALPKVLINNHVNEVFTGANKETKKYLNDRMGRAKWLLNSLETRAKNMFAIAQVIAKEQQDFFHYGVESLKPLTLKQVADVVGVHESTVSRITTGKYLNSVRGTFELKYFFSAGIGTTGGNTEVAAMSVKAMIKRLIGDEDARKPLSDEKLVKLLKDEGVDVARRTVAKYREALGIMSSSGRRIK